MMVTKPIRVGAGPFVAFQTELSPAHFLFRDGLVPLHIVIPTATWPAILLYDVDGL
jgi:hypothetical protein